MHSDVDAGHTNATYAAIGKFERGGRCGQGCGIWCGMSSSNDAYFKALCKTSSNGVLVPYRAVCFRNGKPTGSHCHSNVDTWVEENPQCKPVRGWLVSGGILDAHSVVESADGVLFDITPLSACRRPRFLRHPGTESEFQALRKCHEQVICAVLE